MIIPLDVVWCPHQNKPMSASSNDTSPSLNNGMEDKAISSRAMACMFNLQIIGKKKKSKTLTFNISSSFEVPHLKKKVNSFFIVFLINQHAYNVFLYIALLWWINEVTYLVELAIPSLPTSNNCNLNFS